MEAAKTGMKRDREYWKNYEEEQIEKHRKELIPWAKTTPELFKTVEKNGVLSIMYKKTMFPENKYTYKAMEVPHEDWGSKSYWNKTKDMWVFYVKADETPLEEVVKDYMRPELKNPDSHDNAEIFHKVEKLVKEDPRKEECTYFLYMKGVFDVMTKNGFSQQRAKAIFLKFVFKNWKHRTDEEKTKINAFNNKYGGKTLKELTRELMRTYETDYSKSNLAQKKMLEDILNEDSDDEDERVRCILEDEEISDTEKQEKLRKAGRKVKEGERIRSEEEP